MENHTLVQVFGSYHEADLMKTILKKNDIEAVVYSEQDRMNLTLFGNINLYVPDYFAEKASMVLDEYWGWFRLASSSRMEMCKQIGKILDSNEIPYEIREKRRGMLQFYPYEVFVKLEHKEKVVAALDEHSEWTQIATYLRMRQAEMWGDILSRQHINYILISRRNDDYNIISVELCVENENVEKAQKIINCEETEEWKLIYTFNDAETLIFNENILNDSRVQTLVTPKPDGKFEIRVTNLDERKAILLINEHREWEKLAAIENVSKAELLVEMLGENDIKAVTVSEKDSVFLWGEVELYVEKGKVEEAQEILDNFEKYRLEKMRKKNQPQFADDDDEYYDDDEYDDDDEYYDEDEDYDEDEEDIDEEDEEENHSNKK